MSHVQGGWIDCASPPMALYKQPNPVIYTAMDSKQYILFTECHYDAFRRIYQYDIQNDTYNSQFASYKSLFRPQSHAHIVNTVTNELYVFGGASNCFGKLNLSTKKWKYIKQQVSKIPNKFVHSTATFIPFSINSFHAINPDGIHITFNKNTQQFVSYNINIPLIQLSDFFMVSIVNKLVIINGLDLSIFYVDINSPNQTSYKWIKLKYKLTTKNPLLRNIHCDPWTNSKCVVAYNGDNAILLVFHFNWQILFYCDLGRFSKNVTDRNIEYEWKSIKSKTSFPTGTFVVMDNKEYIHFIHVFDSEPWHKKIKLSTILPNHLYNKHNAPIIVSGYVHSVENYLSYIVPTEIIDFLIVYYI